MAITRRLPFMGLAASGRFWMWRRRGCVVAVTLACKRQSNTIASSRHGWLDLEECRSTYPASKLPGSRSTAIGARAKPTSLAWLSR